MKLADLTLGQGDDHHLGERHPLEETGDVLVSQGESALVSQHSLADQLPRLVPSKILRATRYKKRSCRRINASKAVASPSLAARRSSVSSASAIRPRAYLLYSLALQVFVVLQRKRPARVSQTSSDITNNFQPDVTFEDLPTSNDLTALEEADGCPSSTSQSDSGLWRV
jgi:hypothetical protein